MSSPNARPSGIITTTGVAVSTGAGVMTYAQASTDSEMRIYDGTSSAGTLMAAVPAAERQAFDPPVIYGTGLWAVPGSTVGSSAGSVGGAVIHYS